MMVQVRGWILQLWHWLDPIYYGLTRLQQITGDKRDNVFRVRVMKYYGRTVRFSDGTLLERGDLVLRIHLHNVVLLQEMRKITNDLSRARWLYRRIERSLPDLCAYVQTYAGKKPVKGILGITMLNRGTRSLGFRTITIEHGIYRLYRRCTQLPIHLLSVDKPLQTWNKYQPVYLYLAKEELVRRYKPPAQKH